MKKIFTFSLLLCLCTAAFTQNSSPYWSITGNNNETGTSKLGTTNNTSLHFYTNNSQRMYIDSSNGRVGIGTTAPQDRLHVNSSGSENAFRAQVGGSTKLLVYSNGGTALGSNVTPPANGLYVYGNTGLGNTTPVYKLQVKGDIDIDSGAYRFAGDPVLKYNVSNQSIAVGNAGGTGTRLNTAVGYQALTSNTTGQGNVAVGHKSLYSDNTGYSNVAIGSHALYSNTSGIQSIGVGDSALFNNTVSYNVAVGSKALYSNTTGGSNVANGCRALYYNEAGYSNIAIGAAALFNNTAASNNVAVGDSALFNNNNDNNYYDGNNNTGLGSKSLYANQKGYENVATGSAALYNSTDGYWNTATGSRSMSDNTTGSLNTAIGFSALAWNSTGNYNTSLGAHSSYVVDAALDNNTTVGYNAQISASNAVRIGNSSVSSIGGQVGWTNFSDERIKNNIKEDVPGLLFIKMLRPVTYNFNLKKENEVAEIKNDTAKWKTKYDIEKTKFTGFIAQEVDAAAKKINYDFSGVDQTGKIWGLRYAEFVVPLVKGEQELSKQNDSLKTQNTILSSKVDDLQNQINQLRTMIVSSASGQLSISVSSASLAQNIPNPFANSTSISYVLPQTYSSARIIITDNKGVALKQITLNTKGKGSAIVDASTLSAGAYQYSLYVNERLIDTKQMLRVK